MDQLSYGAFSADLHQRQSGQRAPMQVSIEVTRRCPLECQHCYNNLPMGDQDARSREMTTEEHFKHARRTGRDGLLLAPLHRRRNFRPQRLSRDLHLRQEKRIPDHPLHQRHAHQRKDRRLPGEWPPFSIEITLYGRTRETYEALTQIPGSYDRCLRGIKLLRERGLPLKLKTVATSINKHEVIAMRQFAEEELGVEFKFDGQVNPRIDCSQSPLAVRLTPEEVVALDMNAPKGVTEYQRLAKRDLENPPNLAKNDTVYFCGGGMNSFAINAHGEMGICVISQQDTFRVQEAGLKRVWEESLLQLRTRKRTQVTKCVQCRIQSLCGMCPANGEMENGDKESPVEFLCNVAHLRAAVIGVEVPSHGKCEFCAGGNQHEEVLESARRIKSKEIDVESWVGPQQAFQILNNASAATGGCGSCGGH
jgi:radical SAM protein with 4Fe4S-binding SPASM domain